MHYKGRIKVFIFCIAVLIGMLFISFVLIRGTYDYPLYDNDFENKLKLEINGIPKPNISYKDWNDFKVEKNSVVTLHTKMPADTPDLARINIKVLYSSLELFLDNQSVYSYGLEEQRLGKPLATGYHKIRLPKDYHNKELVIQVTPSNSYKLSYIIQHLSFGANKNIIIFIVRQNIFAFMTSMFLIVFGIIIFITYITMSFRFHQEVIGLSYLSIFTFCIGLWSLCSTDFIQLFNDVIIINHYVEYFAFYMIFPSWIFVISFLKKNPVFDKWLMILKLLFILFSAVIIFTQIFQITNYDNFLSIYHLLALISSISSLFILGYKFKTQPPHEKLLFIGSIVTISGTVIQGILYNLIKFFDFPFKYAQVLWLYLIMLLIVCTFIVSYGMKFSKSIISARELKLLQKMAYEDSLTGLGNRQSGVIQLLNYEKEQQNYFLILFDLNNLKTTNDKYGHATGDQMLISFAKCLNTAFQENSSKLRIGGDEFLVIVPTSDLSVINQSINKLKTEMSNIQKTADNEPISLEVAYGIASTDELSSFDYEFILSMADKRMYINKQMVKEHKEEQLESVYHNAKI